MFTENTKFRVREIEKIVRVKIYGKRNATERRACLERIITRLNPLMHGRKNLSDTRFSWQVKKITRRLRAAIWLAKQAELYFDEHGSARGSYRTTQALDFVSPQEAKNIPYCDMGNRGLGLIKVTRTTIYAKSSKWWPTSGNSRFLVGRNESGTYFAHSVPKDIASVKEAIHWIWKGNQNNIILRQGDIALIKGSGPKGMDKLPLGHSVSGRQIVHATHPAIPIPDKGQRIIIGRRASEYVAAQTRD